MWQPNASTLLVVLIAGVLFGVIALQARKKKVVNGLPTLAEVRKKPASQFSVEEVESAKKLIFAARQIKEFTKLRVSEEHRTMLYSYILEFAQLLANELFLRRGVRVIAEDSLIIPEKPSAEQLANLATRLRLEQSRSRAGSLFDAATRLVELGVEVYGQNRDIVHLDLLNDFESGANELDEQLSFDRLGMLQVED